MFDQICAFFGCSPAPGNGSINNTAAEVRLQFNSSVAPEQLPTPDDVEQTLVDAVSNPNNTFNVSIQPNSVQVLGKQSVATHLTSVAVQPRHT